MREGQEKRKKKPEEQEEECCLDWKGCKRIAIGWMDAFVLLVALPWWSQALTVRALLLVCLKRELFERERQTEKQRNREKQKERRCSHHRRSVSVSECIGCVRVNV